MTTEKSNTLQLYDAFTNAYRHAAVPMFDKLSSRAEQAISSTNTSVTSPIAPWTAQDTIVLSVVISIAMTVCTAIGLAYLTIYTCLTRRWSRVTNPETEQPTVPDRAIESHQDELEEVDSVDEDDRCANTHANGDEDDEDTTLQSDTHRRKSCANLASQLESGTVLTTKKPDTNGKTHRRVQSCARKSVVSSKQNGVAVTVKFET
jgi:hypothetical protein